MKTLLTILTLVISLSSFSQKREIILIVDTLLTEKTSIGVNVRTAIDTNITRYPNNTDTLKSNSLLLGEYTVKQLHINTPNPIQYNLLMPIVLADSNAIIDLLLDDSGGVLTIKRSYFINSDTIRINKLKVFQSCLPDSVKLTLSKFRKYNNKSKKQLRLLKTKVYPTNAVKKNCKEKIPNEISITVNQQKMVLYPVILSYKNSISWYHGHKKGRIQKRLYERRKSAGKKYTYFSVCKNTISYHLFAELVLK